MAGGEALPLVGRTPKAWAPLLLGLRTGFCGSLTSFSSWNQAVVALLVTHSKWREAERSGIRVFVSELAPERTRIPLYSPVVRCIHCLPIRCIHAVLSTRCTVPYSRPEVGVLGT